MGKLRPQIFLAIIVLGLLSAVGVYFGYTEIATGCTGGIIALGMPVSLSISSANSKARL